MPDRLYLVTVSGLPEFRALYDALSSIEVYNLNLREIASMQKPDPGEILRRDGSNAASVLQRLTVAEQSLVNDFLARIVPIPRSAGSPRSCAIGPTQDKRDARSRRLSQ